MDNSEKRDRIETLVQTALGLNEAERTDFLRNLESEDREVALELIRLLAAYDTRLDRLDDSSTIHAEPPTVDESETQPQGFFTKETTISNYRIVSMLGKGGMNEVYLADDAKLRRKVAIKVLPPESLVQ